MCVFACVLLCVVNEFCFPVHKRPYTVVAVVTAAVLCCHQNLASSAFQPEVKTDCSPRTSAPYWDCLRHPAREMGQLPVPYFSSVKAAVVGLPGLYPVCQSNKSFFLYSSYWWSLIVSK